MKKEFDAVIIGGGPGGLAAGCLLAKEGVKSVIIERAPALGGRFRSVNFHGCRVDSSVKFFASQFGSAERSFCYRLFSHLGLPLKNKAVPWTMGLVTKDKPGTVDHFAMDPKLGAENFFEFFAFATGVSMSEESKKEVKRVADIAEDMSEEECRKVVNVPFADWIDKNVEDPIVHAVLSGMGPVIGAPIKDVNFGMVANALGTFNRVGSIHLWYPTPGPLEDAIIAPLAKYYKEHGGKAVMNRRVRSINIENGKATGVVAQDENNCNMLEEYGSRVVICAMPIFEAVARNVISQELLRKDWAEAVRKCGELAIPDLSAFFLLREHVMPEEGYGWIHVFDFDYGLPTYVGDWCLGSHIDAKVPAGTQLVCGMIPGSLEATNLGLTSPMDKVREAQRRWKEAVEKAFPGFGKAIQYEGMNLQLNFTRYAYAVVPVEIDFQPPNIKGLYFAGDSIRSVSTQMSDKCFHIAFPLCERVVDYLERARSRCPNGPSSRRVRLPEPTRAAPAEAISVRG
jgi:phytoene dehydrogenase-like protein